MAIRPHLQQIWDRLRLLRTRNRVPHAILLHGSDAADRHDLAQMLVQSLLCLSLQDGSACGRCRSCQLWASGNHPDYCAVGDDKGIGIDDVRSITGFLQQTPHQGGYKVLLLEKADQLLPAAANALLKSLEEPDPQTVFILTAARPQRLLPTLRSRCFAVGIPLHAHVWDDALVQPIEAALKGKMSEWLQQEELRRLITERPMEALYFIYYWVAGLVRTTAEKTGSPSRHVNTRALFGFLDLVSEAISAAQLPGVNKPLLFEALLIQWHQLTSGEAA